MILGHGKQSIFFFPGRWLSNPYVAFAAGALVEIVAYFIVHLVLDRWGRKLTFCGFVFFFGIVAYLVVPIQMFMVKDGQGRISISIVALLRKVFIFSTSGSYVPY